MNKLKITTIAACIALFSNTAVLASGNTLDIDASIDSGITSSYKIKSIDISIKQAQNSYTSDIKKTGSYGDQLDTPNLDKYTRLSIMENIANKPREDKFDEYKYTQMKTVAENEVKISAYTQYISLMNAKDYLDLEKEKFKNAQDKYDSSKVKLDVGTISPAQLKQAEADYYSEKAALEKAERQYDLCVINMNKTLGRDIYEKYDVLLRDKLTEDPYIRSYKDYLNDALTKRAEILIGEENIELQKFEYNITRSVFPDTQSVPRRFAQAKLDNAKDSLEIAKLDIIPEINSLYNDVLVKAKTLQSKKDALELEKINYNMASTKYNVGVISRIDFQSEAIKLKEEENTVKAAEREIWLAQHKLNLACNEGYDTSKLN
jgi:hypothetical protein